MKKNYPLNVPPKISNLKELVQLRTTMPNKVAFKYKQKDEIIEISAEKFKNDIDALGTFLHSQGVVNSKVALVGENSYLWIVSYFAVVNGGNVIVPIDKELPAEDMKELMVRSGASAIIFSKRYALAAELNENLKHFPMADFKKYLAEGRSLIQDGCNSFTDYEVDPNKLCSIIYTSGTTGFPKGVMLCHRNFVSDIMSGYENIYVYGGTMLTLPLHHTFAFTTSVLAELLYDKTISISLSLKTFKSDLQEFKPQNMFVVPLYVESMYKNIWRVAEKNKKDRLLKNMIKVSNALRKVGIDLRKVLFKTILDNFGGKLDLLISGGAALDEKYIKAFGDFGITVLNGYGITECAPVVAVNRNKTLVRNSAGPILSCCEVKSVDGELWVKGDNVMLGYYNDETATRAAMHNGWFNTGDLGYVENNCIYITGRAKNLIILSNGKNVSPEELEQKILNIENVIEVLVYAKDGSITAEIYSEDQTNIESGIDNLNKKLPPYKRIKNVIFRHTEFPKTTIKKIKRPINNI